MRDYAKVSPLFWTGNTGREIRALGQECQLAALYLMTGPGATMLGVYHMPAVLLAHAIGSPLEGASKALRSLSEGGFCVYDEDSEWVWVREMAAWQIDDELARDDNRVKGIAKDWLALPNLPFLNEFFERYQGAFHLPKRPNAQAPTKALASPSQAPPKPGAGTGEGTRAGEKNKKPADAGDPKTTIWNLGVSLLTTHGSTEGSARSFLGQYAKGREGRLAEVIGYLAANPKLEPKAYIAAAMKDGGHAGELSAEDVT